MTASFLSL